MNPALHEAVLDLIESLCRLDPAPESPEGRLLTVLASAMEAYEREAFPITSTDP